MRIEKVIQEQNWSAKLGLRTLPAAGGCGDLVIRPLGQSGCLQVSLAETKDFEIVP